MIGWATAESPAPARPPSTHSVLNLSNKSPKAILGASVMLLAAVAVAWGRGAGDPRSDLSGGIVRQVTTRPASVRSQPRSSIDRRTTGAPVERPVGADTTTNRADGADETTRVTPTPPQRLVIPTLGVDAAIVPVGLEPDGSMEIPGAAEAGWYQYGPRPGDPSGSAVLAGHVDHNRTAGVFIELRRLGIGDEIEVTNRGGVARRFRVAERFQVDKDELPGPELFRTTGDPVLTLITCGGRFNRKLRRYADNIVIRATPVLGEQLRPNQQATFGDGS